MIIKNNDGYVFASKSGKESYTIQSISDEGEYYLVNGWNKHKTFWTKEQNKALFNTPNQAKASLTKLLKVMDEYETDTFYLLKIVCGNVAERLLMER